MSEQIPPRLRDARSSIPWLQARYRFGEDCGHIAVPETGLTRLREMADEIVGSHDLVAIYIPDTPVTTSLGTTRRMSSIAPNSPTR